MINYFFALFCNRSKADESESDITYHFDLDSSFKRMLNEKRQVTNKENNPPSAEQSTSATNPPEKPMRKDLMKDRKLFTCKFQLICYLNGGFSMKLPEFYHLNQLCQLMLYSAFSSLISLSILY